MGADVVLHNSVMRSRPVRAALVGVIAVVAIIGCSAGASVSMAARPLAAAASETLHASPEPEITVAPATTSSPVAPATTAPATTAVPDTTEGAQSTTRSIRVAVVGDSLSAGDTGHLSDGLNGNSWMTYAQGDGIVFAGGWAVAGTTVQEQAAAVTPISDVDVLVLMSGTNDVRLGLSFASSAASYDSIVATIHPKHVIIGALPPHDSNPTGATAYERQLAVYAKSKGWTVFDPWAFARDGDRWNSIYSADGTHPVTYGYMRAGDDFHNAILAVEGERKTAASGRLAG